MNLIDPRRKFPRSQRRGSAVGLLNSDDGVQIGNQKKYSKRNFNYVHRIRQGVGSVQHSVEAQIEKTKSSGSSNPTIFIEPQGNERATFVTGTARTTTGAFGSAIHNIVSKASTAASTANGLVESAAVRNQEGTWASIEDIDDNSSLGRSFISDGQLSCQSEQARRTKITNGGGIKLAGFPDPIPSKDSENGIDDLVGRRTELENEDTIHALPHATESTTEFKLDRKLKRSSMSDSKVAKSIEDDNNNESNSITADFEEKDDGEDRSIGDEYKNELAKGKSCSEEESDEVRCDDDETIYYTGQDVDDVFRAIPQMTNSIAQFNLASPIESSKKCFHSSMKSFHSSLNSFHSSLNSFEGLSYSRLDESDSDISKSCDNHSNKAGSTLRQIQAPPLTTDDDEKDDDYHRGNDEMATIKRSTTGTAREEISTDNAETKMVACRSSKIQAALDQNELEPARKRLESKTHRKGNVGRDQTDLPSPRRKSRRHPSNSGRRDDDQHDRVKSTSKSRSRSQSTSTSRRPQSRNSRSRSKSKSSHRRPHSRRSRPSITERNSRPSEDKQDEHTEQSNSMHNKLEENQGASFVVSKRRESSRKRQSLSKSKSKSERTLSTGRKGKNTYTNENGTERRDALTQSEHSPGRLTKRRSNRHNSTSSQSKPFPMAGRKDVSRRRLNSDILMQSEHRSSRRSLYNRSQSLQKMSSTSDHPSSPSARLTRGSSSRQKVSTLPKRHLSDLGGNGRKIGFASTVPRRHLSDSKAIEGLNQLE